MSIATASDLDDFNLGLANDVLLPILTESDLSLDLQLRRSEICQNSMGASLTSQGRYIILLNEKQHLVVESVMSNLLACVNHPYGSSMRKHNLLHVGGESGLGKSQIIKAIVDLAVACVIITLNVIINLFTVSKMVTPILHRLKHLFLFPFRFLPREL
jgi:hypothetical protein